MSGQSQDQATRIHHAGWASSLRMAGAEARESLAAIGGEGHKPCRQTDVSPAPLNKAGSEGLHSGCMNQGPIASQVLAINHRNGSLCSGALPSQPA